MGKKDFSRLTRPIHPMPGFVRRALLETGLMAEYEERPPYQQNDYIGWINRAKREATRRRCTRSGPRRESTTDYNP